MQTSVETATLGEAAAISSIAPIRATLPALIPPYSSGKGMPRMPASAICLNNESGVVWVASISSESGATDFTASSWARSRIIC